MPTPANNSAGSSRAPRIVTAGIPLLLVALCGLLALEPELRLAVPLLVGVTAVMAVLLACTLYCGKRLRPSWPPAVVLAVALALRLMFLAAPAQLSDDIYRYLWDGSNLLRGVNPYAAPPSAMKPPSELKEVHARVNHPQYATIYPPAAQLIFAGGTALGGGAFGLKAFLVLFDLLLCALLMLLLRQLGMPVWLSTLYAWNPLPVLEIAGSGHVDGAGMTLLMGSISLLLVKGERRWPTLCAGALLAAAGLVKLFPFALVPALFLLVTPSRRIHFAGGFLGAAAALVLPFMPQLINMLHTLQAYARHWEFAGFAFTVLRFLTGSGTAARLILSCSFLLFATAIPLRLAAEIKGLEPAPRAARTLRACYAIALALLLCTPTLQPWYALFLAAFLPFGAGGAGLVLCWVVFLTYRVQIPYFIMGEWIESPQVTAALFLAPAAAWGMSRLSRIGRERRERG